MVSRSTEPELSLPTRILDAAESALRRYGVEKTNVVDIARALGMSHGNVYRHYPSKKALLDAVAARWLCAVAEPLEVFVEDPTRSAAERLERWFEALREAKRHKVLDDPELFRVYHGITQAANEVVTGHVATLIGQLQKIIGEGIEAGEFPRTTNAELAARAFFHAGFAFHHPSVMLQGRLPTDADAHTLVKLLIAGLRAGV